MTDAATTVSKRVPFRATRWLSRPEGGGGGGIPREGRGGGGGSPISACTARMQTCGHWTWSMENWCWTRTSKVKCSIAKLTVQSIVSRTLSAVGERASSSSSSCRTRTRVAVLGNPLFLLASSFSFSFWSAWAKRPRSWAISRSVFSLGPDRSGCRSLIFLTMATAAGWCWRERSWECCKTRFLPAHQQPGMKTTVTVSDSRPPTLLNPGERWSLQPEIPRTGQGAARASTEGPANADSCSRRSSAHWARIAPPWASVTQPRPHGETERTIDSIGHRALGRVQQKKGNKASVRPRG